MIGLRKGASKEAMSDGVQLPLRTESGEAIIPNTDGRVVPCHAARVPK
jgi:hypothetical protein